MGTLNIHLFGKFDLRLGRRALSGLEAGKAQELLCYLLLYRDRPHPREGLAGLLWADVTTDRSKKYLRKTLWQLQTALDAQTENSNGRILLVETGWVQLNPDADLWLDVAVFEQAFSLVRGVPGRELVPERIQTLQDAVNLYRGDLLEGCYQDWCLYERERLQHMYLAMLDKLMDSCEAQQKYETGLIYGTRILRYDRARERTHRRLMRLYYLAGHRTAALRQYERCVLALDEALGVQPGKSTVALYEQIRADQLAGPAPPLTAAPAASEVIAGSPDVPGRLHNLRAALTGVQRQVENTIQAIDLALNGGRQR